MQQNVHPNKYKLLCVKSAELGCSKFADLENKFQNFSIKHLLSTA
jgi:hypothetical protein